MPLYREPLAGVGLSEAAAEAYAVAPIGRAMLQTLSLTHPAFDADVHIVCDHADMTASLEDGTEVQFQSLPVDVVWPDQTDSAEVPRVQLTIDNVSGIVVEQLDKALSTIVPVQAIPRVYASDELEGPAHDVAATFELSAAQVTDTRVTATAVIDDGSNRAFPSKTYRRAEYPGLTAR